MDALNLPDNYTYESQQGEDEIRVYIKEVTDEESAWVCLVTIFFGKRSILRQHHTSSNMLRPTWLGLVVRVGSAWY